MYLRPDTFVIFDRVRSPRPEFRKTWLLQAMKRPERAGPHWVVTNGRGRLFVQTLLPEDPRVVLVSGEDLYAYDGRSFPPSREGGPAPECRLEVSPPRPATTDLFLHVLTAADSGTAAVPAGRLGLQGGEVVAAVGEAKVGFRTDGTGGWVERGGARTPLGGRWSRGRLRRRPAGSRGAGVS